MVAVEIVEVVPYFRYANLLVLTSCPASVLPTLVQTAILIGIYWLDPAVSSDVIITVFTVNDTMYDSAIE